MWALSTASSKRVGARTDHRAGGRHLGHDLEIHLLVVERHHVAAGREVVQVRGDEGGSEHDLAGHAAGRVVGALRQDGHGEAERAGRLTGHTGQLTCPDEPDGVGAQVARPRPGIRLDSGADTTGTLREEHQGHGQTAAYRGHDRRRPAVPPGRRRAAALRRGGVRPCLRVAGLRARPAHPPGRRRHAGARDRPGDGRGAGAPAPPHDAGGAGPHGPGGDGQPPHPRDRPLPPGDGRGHLGDELREAGALHGGVPGLAHASPPWRGGQQHRRASHHHDAPAPRRPRRHRPAGPGRRSRHPHAEAGGHRGRRHRDLDDRHRHHREPHRAHHPRRRRGRRDGPSRGSGSPCRSA